MNMAEGEIIAKVHIILSVHRLLFLFLVKLMKYFSLPQTKP